MVHPLRYWEKNVKVARSLARFEEELVSGRALRGGCHQSKRGGLCATGAGGVGGRCAGRVCASDSELVDSSGPVVLVVVLGDDDLGRPGSRGRGCGACAAMVHDGGDPLEECLLVDLSDGQAVGVIILEGLVG